MLQVLGILLLIGLLLVLLPLLLTGIVFFVPLLTAVIAYLVMQEAVLKWELSPAFKYVVPVAVFVWMVRRMRRNIRVVRVHTRDTSYSDPYGGEVIDAEFTVRERPHGELTDVRDAADRHG